MMKKLSEVVFVSRSFQRSMRIDRDYSQNSESAVEGYIAQDSLLRVLQMMAAHIKGSKQRAFTWTGPYGSGKSSLALMLCSLVGGGAARRAALDKLHLPETDDIVRVFGSGGAWQIVAITGRQARLAVDLGQALHTKEEERSVVNRFRELADALPAEGGLLVVIDELGKYLEADCASENAYLLQELAETANRCANRAILVGVLHQAVDVYVSRMPKELRVEWDKVKGRFVDMPVRGSSEEVLELLGRAISAASHVENPAFAKVVEAVAADCATRQGSAERFSFLLKKCWPLNPVTALLLGPVSRRKFSQNERSIYSFLGSREPLGFQQFLESHEEDALYSPADYWDYLKTNFEAAILTTGESHRWMTAVDAVERAERRGLPVHVSMAKSLALIDLFRQGSGLEATLAVLSASLLISEDDARKVIRDLLDWKIAIERRHINAFAVFAGSDFDIDVEIADAAGKFEGIDAALIPSLVELPPVVARSYYMRLGTLRWFNRVILPLEDVERWMCRKHEDDGTTGAFVLVLPNESNTETPQTILEKLFSTFGSKTRSGLTVIFGVPQEAADIRSLLEELQALHVVAKNPLLEGDETGRKEVATRTAQTRDLLLEKLSSSFANASWKTEAGSVKRAKKEKILNEIANQVAENLYSAAPMICNELINRDFPSTNIVSARRLLLNRMLTHETEENLGYTGFPADFGLYLSMLQSIRKKDDDGLWRFDTSAEPTGDPEDQYVDFWKRTTEFLKERATATLEEIYVFWRQPPMGLRKGPMPILSFAYYLANRNNIALYVNGTFVPAASSATVDEWLLDPRRIAFRYINNSTSNRMLMKNLAKVLCHYTGSTVEETPLAVARAIVKIVYESPKLAQHSTAYSSMTLRFKQTALKASDPIKFLLSDAPSIFGTSDPEKLSKAIDDALKEYLAAVPELIDKTSALLLKAIDASANDLVSLNKRAKAIKGLSGKMVLEAFIARLEKFTNSKTDIEGLIGLACAKPVFNWTDGDMHVAQTKLCDLAFEFRRVEAQGALRNRQTSRRVFSLVLGGAEEDITETVDLSADASEKASRTGKQIEAIIKTLPKEVALAALAQAGINYLKGQ